MNDFLPPAAATRTNHRKWPTLAIWGLVAFGWLMLYVETIDIRAANLDDVAFSRWQAQGNYFDQVRTWERTQGRYYGFAAFTPFWLLNLVEPAWLFQALRLGLVATSVWLLGQIAARVTGSDELRQLWWLLWIAGLQIPPTFYALLSYPFYHCGLILSLLAALVFWRDLDRDPPARIPWCAGMIFFAALQFQESFLVFTVLFPALWYFRTAATARRNSWRMLLPTTLAAVLYLGIYFTYRAGHPPVYEGTSAGGDLGGMLGYITRYSAASLPGFELVIDRDVSHPAIAGPAEITRRLATFNSWRLPWVFAVGAASAWLVWKSHWRQSRRQVLTLAAGAAAMGLLCLSLPALSAKYQAFAHRRFYPHAYNFGLVLFGWLAVAILVLGAAGAWPRPSRDRLVLAVAFGTAIALICFVAQVTNPLALEQIRKTVATAP